MTSAKGVQNGNTIATILHSVSLLIALCAGRGFAADGTARRLLTLDADLNEMQSWLGNAMDPSVLVVDDNQFLRAMIAQELQEMGIAPFCAADGREGATRLRSGEFALVIADLEMPLMNGVDFIRKVIGEQPQAKVIALTDSDAGLAAEAGRLGAAVLQKPFLMLDLREKVKAALASAQGGEPTAG